MFKPKSAFSGFSADDMEKAKKFYGETLGLEVEEMAEMGFSFKLPGGGQHFVYPKDDHQPASFTVLNFVVDDLDQAMAELKAKGIEFEQYNLGNGAKTDEKGVLRGLSVGMGPDIAWFKDPAGNVLSVLQEE